MRKLISLIGLCVQTPVHVTSPDVHVALLITLRVMGYMHMCPWLLTALMHTMRPYGSIYSMWYKPLLHYL